MLCINRLYKYENMLKSKGVELFYTNPIQIQLITQSLGSEYTWFRDYSNELVDNLINNFPNLPELTKIQKALDKIKNGKKTKLVFVPNEKTIRAMDDEDNFLKDVRASKAFRKLIRDYKKLFSDSQYIQELDEYTMIRYTDFIMDDPDILHDFYFAEQRIFPLYSSNCPRDSVGMTNAVHSTKYLLISSQYPNIFTIEDENLKIAMLLKTIELMEQYGYVLK